MFPSIINQKWLVCPCVSEDRTQPKRANFPRRNLWRTSRYELKSCWTCSNLVGGLLAGVQVIFFAEGYVLPPPSKTWDLHCYVRWWEGMFIAGNWYFCCQNQLFFELALAEEGKTNHSLNRLIVGGKVSPYRHPGNDANQVVRISQEMWGRSWIKKLLSIILPCIEGGGYA